MLVIGVGDKAMKMAKKVDSVLATLCHKYCVQGNFKAGCPLVNGGLKGACLRSTHAIWGFFYPSHAIWCVAETFLLPLNLISWV